MTDSGQTHSSSIPEIDNERVLDSLTRVAVLATLTHLGATGASLVGDSTVRSAMVVVFAALFLAGVGACVAAFFVAINRSRHELVDLGGAFFLVGGVIAADAKKRLFLLWGAQVVIGVGAASVAPLTAVAFSVLVPLIGLGIIALTGSLCGDFPSKPDVEY